MMGRAGAVRRGAIVAGVNQPFPNTFGDQVVVARSLMARLWRNDLGHNAIAISNQHVSPAERCARTR